MSESVIFSIDSQKIAHITLNRPQVHNALGGETLENLIDILEILHQDSTLRALVFHGNGKSFCAGADISWMEKLNHGSVQDNNKASSQLASVFHLLNTLPVPTLTLVHGDVRGGGLGILACSDVVISADAASFAFSEVRIGMVPAIIAPYVIQAIGLRQARRFLLTGEIFNAQKALEIGLIHEIIHEQETEKRVTSILEALLQCGPQAHRKTKSLIQSIAHDLRKIELDTVDLNTQVRQSKECQEGFTAFLNKKKPPWSSND